MENAPVEPYRRKVTLPEKYRRKLAYGGLTDEEVLECANELARDGTTAAVAAHDENEAAHGLGAPTAHTDSATVQPGPHSNAGASGAVVLTLGDVTAGARYRFDVLAAQTLTITAPSGTTIRVGSQATASGGSISSDVVGASIQLVAVAAGAFVANSTVEVW